MVLLGVVDDCWLIAATATADAAGELATMLGMIGVLIRLLLLSRLYFACSS